MLEAVRDRRLHESLALLQSCVHRKGLDWLHQFQTLTLPALEGNDAAAWLEVLLGNSSGQATPSGAALLGSPAGESFSTCLLYTSPSPRDRTRSRMPSSA